MLLYNDHYTFSKPVLKMMRETISQGCADNHPMGCFAAAFEISREAEQRRNHDFHLLPYFLYHACRFSDAEACATNPFHMIEYAFSVLPTKKMELQANCNRGSATDCQFLIFVLHFESGSSTLTPQISSIYRKLCEMGQLDNCAILPYAYRELGSEAIDESAMIELSLSACLKGSAGSCTNLGYLHETGSIANGRMSEAARLYEIGCELSEAVSCANLGYLYENGLHFPRNRKMARFFLVKSCYLGLENVCVDASVTPR